MKFKNFTFLVLLIALLSTGISLTAQYNMFQTPTGNSGIRIPTGASPLSFLCVDGVGNVNWSSYFHTSSTQNGSSAIYAEADQPNGGADHVRSISGIIESGIGYTYGVQGTAGTTNPSAAGRAYGVFGQASNASPGANYGLYGRLYGSNDGTAILGIDDINFFDPNAVLLTGTWAGYFIGNTHVTNNAGIGSQNPLSRLSVNGDGNANWSGYFYSDGSANGSTAIQAVADTPTGGADHVRSISANIESGTGYTYGVQGTAATTNPSNAGRAYGVYGQASNATPGANYGLYGRLFGSNDGTAILGIDEINFPGPVDVLVDGTWAGYFIGNTHVTESLGIGCTSLSYATSTGINYKLFVEGGLVAREISVNNGAWCDYVFEKDYPLLSLSEVEIHIEENGHLHNTPSAADIEKQGGFEVGEMTRNQQEKIEELYLHMIEMNKRMIALELENTNLKTEVANLKK